MKRFLLLAVLLLNLLVEVNGQNYSSETYGSNTTWNSDLSELWSRAQESNADIYTEVYDADSYEHNDYSQYGNFSQEVAYPDGTHVYYDYGSSNGSLSNSGGNNGSMGSGEDGTSHNHSSDSSGSGSIDADNDGDKDITWQIELDNVEVWGSENVKFYCVLCDGDISEKEWPTHDCQSAIIEVDQLSDIFNNSDDGSDEGSIGGKSNNIGTKPSNPKKWVEYLMKALKANPNIHLVSDKLPDTFPMQKERMECVANSIAIVAEIVEGTDPQKTKADLYKIARRAGYDIAKAGIPASEIRYFLFNDYAITNDNKFSRNVVESYIDTEHKPVMAILDVTPSTTPFVSEGHMVVIVGYDAFNYYCAAGRENPVAIPKTDFEIKIKEGTMKYDIYFYNGKKKK